MSRHKRNKPRPGGRFVRKPGAPPLPESGSVPEPREEPPPPPGPPQPEPVAWRGPAPSLPEMRQAHHALRLRRRDEPAEAIKGAVADFLARWPAVGEVREAAGDRRDAQGMLDYWVAESYRVFGDAPEAGLADPE